MTFGAETKTRWLWFLTYIFLPLNVIGQIIGLIQFLDLKMGGLGLIVILAELGLCIAAIIGLHQQKPWGWYCILLIFVLQLFGTPFKVYQKESLRYEILQSGNRVRDMQGQSPIRNDKPSVFDFQPVLTFFLLLGIWTLPNVIYLYRRKQIFGIAEHPFVSGFDYRISSRDRTAQGETLAIEAIPRTQSQTAPDSSSYAQAWEELESGARVTGLWAKAFAEANGDEVQSKALYLQYRAREFQEQAWARKVEKRRNDIRSLLAEAEAGKECARQALFDIRKDTDIATEFCQVDMEVVEASAQAGSLEALNLLGRMYYSDSIIKPDYERAFSYFSRAAQQGHPLGMYNLSCCYLNEIGTKFSDSLGVQWMKESAENGYVEAMYQIGLMYSKGNNVKKNAKQANRWFVQAAEQGHREAQAALSQK